jgi:hypothetical protein
MKLSIDLSPAQADRLRVEAGRLRLTPEDLARAAITDLLAATGEDFKAAADRVLKKNQRCLSHAGREGGSPLLLAGRNHPFVDGNKRVGHMPVDRINALQSFPMWLDAHDNVQRLSSAKPRSGSL